MTTPPPEKENQSRDTAYWAEEASVLRVERAPTGALNLNVEGHKTLSPLQGFGQLWQKVYQARVKNASATPGEIVRVWKEDFTLYEMGMRLRVILFFEDRFWRQTLMKLMAHFDLSAPVQITTTCIDKRLQWRQAGNIWQNAAIRTAIYTMLTSLRWIRRSRTPRL